MTQASSTDLQKVEKMAEVANQKLRATDKRFRRSTMVCCEDGSIFLYNSAFYEIWDVDEIWGLDKECWAVIFAEHYAPAIFAFDDLLSIRMFPTRSTGAMLPKIRKVP